MKKNDRKKMRKWLMQHVGHVIRCADGNKILHVRFEGFSNEGMMKVKNIMTQKTEILPEYYLEKDWKFG